MSRAPLVSVVIPSCSHTEFVEQSLASVEAQTYPEVEIVVVDDGSTDATAAVAEAFCRHSQRPAQLLRQANQGAHAAINRGLRAARGSYLAILNSNDYYYPNRLAALVDAARAGGGEFAFSLVEHVNERGAPVRADDPVVAAYRKEVEVFRATGTLGSVIFGYNLSVTASNFLFTRALYQAVGDFAPYRFCHDWDYLLRALLHTQPLVVPEPLLAYRPHAPNSINLDTTLSTLESQLCVLHYRWLRMTHACRNPQAPLVSDPIDVAPVPRSAPAPRLNDLLGRLARYERLGYRVVGQLYAVLDRYPRFMWHAASALRRLRGLGPAPVAPASLVRPERPAPPLPPRRPHNGADQCEPRDGGTPHAAQIAVPHGSIVVYTAIAGNYDSLKEQPHTATQGVDFVAFLDEPRQSKTWRPRAIHTDFRDPIRDAKIHKILSHIYFPDALYSLWIDGSVTIRFPFSIRRLIELYLADCDLAVFQHKSRTCIYQEAGVCLQRRLDDPAIIWCQICRYTQEGYPSNAGLPECTVVLRRHTDTVKAFNEAWWDEITRGSKRDQLSFPYVAWKAGLRYGTFPGSISDNPLFHCDRHPTSFVPRAYEGMVYRASRGGSWLSATARATVLSLRSTKPRRSQAAPSWLRASATPVGSGSACNTAPPARGAERLGQPISRMPDGHAAGLIDVAPPTPALRDSRDRAATTSRGPGPRTVAFGPARDVPSWSWAGLDTARELSKYYDVVIYDSWSTPPDCDVLFVVKERPPDSFINDAQKKTKLVYCPIDAYRDHDQLARDADVFRTCAMVLVHCERLLPLVRSYCNNTHFVEHHARYALNEMAGYKETGFILWIGACQYVPYLVKWLEQHPIDHEIKILTDIDNYRGRHAARVFAAEIGMRFEISEDASSIAGCQVYRWSERRQDEMMRACKAALDVKMTAKFEQRHKPPTKAQQYIASGIPFAVNPDSYSAEYFRVRGLEVASPVETARWLSREYWEATRVCGDRLRVSTSSEAVGSRYRELIESVWAHSRRSAC